ncbi:MAG: hypothetical protein AB7L09_26705 [Nitrospira sp.]
MESDHESVAKSLVATGTAQGLGEIATSLGEIAVDKLLKDGVLRDTPIINSIAALARVGVSISDEILIRKLAKFLDELDRIPHSKRQLLLER